MEILTSRTIIHPHDLERSLAFYGESLGLAVAREFGEGESRGTVFFAGGGLIEVVGSRPGPEGYRVVGADTTAVALWLQVRSVEAALDQITRHGVPVVRPARLEPWGLVEAWVDDPDGLRIHLVEVPPDHPLRRDQRSVSALPGRS